jgi:hypothetical protein
MRAKSGLHPYDAGLFYILSARDGKHWPPHSVEAVSGWRMTRMLAHMFNKRSREVARDVIDLWTKLEEGEHGHERQQQHDPAA